MHFTECQSAAAIAAFMRCDRRETVPRREPVHVPEHVPAPSPAPARPAPAPEPGPVRTPQPQTQPEPVPT